GAAGRIAERDLPQALHHSGPIVKRVGVDTAVEPQVENEARDGLFSSLGAPHRRWNADAALVIDGVDIRTQEWRHGEQPGARIWITTDHHKPPLSPTTAAHSRGRAGRCQNKMK